MYKVNRNTVVLVISVVALLVWGIAVYQWRGYTECQARVLDVVVQVLDVRSDALDEERVAEHKADIAFRDAMNSILANPPNPRAEQLKALTQLQRALDEQEQEREEADKVRAEHPIPELPSKSC